MKHCEKLKHFLFNVTILALDAETSKLGAAISALGVAISPPGTEFPVILV